jgi:hypothetical protein
MTDVNVASESSVSEESVVESSEENSSQEGTSEEVVSEEVVSKDSTPPVEQKYIIQVDGQSLEVTKEELMKGYQRATAADKRFKEAARVKQEADEAMQQINEKGFEAALKASKDPVKFKEQVETWLWNQYQRDKMDPKDRELEELRSEKERLEAERKRDEEEKQKREFDSQTAKQQERYLSQFNDALTKRGIQPEPEIIQGVAGILLEAVKLNYDLSVEDAVDVYMEKTNSSIEKYLKSLDVEKLEGIVGKEKMNMIRKKDIANLKNPIKKPTQKEDNRNNKKDKIYASDFFANLK